MNGWLRATLFFAAAALSMLLSPSAYAESCTASATPLAFGNVATGSNSSYTATATITVSCTGIDNERIQLCPYIGGGSSPGAFGPRYMISGGSQLAFDVFSNAAMTTRYANGVQVGANPGYLLILSGNGSGSMNIPVYGRIPAGQQAVVPGNYTATLSTGSGVVFDDVGSNDTQADCPDGGSSPLATFSFGATARNLASCTLATLPVEFGAVQQLATSRDGTGAVVVNCSAGAAYSIAIDGGSNGGTNGIDRKMASGGSRITYGLYQDAQRAAPWYVGAGNIATGTGTGGNQTITVYGRVPAQAPPAPGTYSDTVTVTITY